MVLAVDSLSAGWQAAFYGIAFGAFTVAVAVDWFTTRAVNLIAVGLALFTFVFFWNALAAT